MSILKVCYTLFSQLHAVPVLLLLKVKQFLLFSFQPFCLSLLLVSLCPQLCQFITGKHKHGTNSVSKSAFNVLQPLVKYLDLLWLDKMTNHFTIYFSLLVCLRYAGRSCIFYLRGNPPVMTVGPCLFLLADVIIIHWNSIKQMSHIVS